MTSCMICSEDDADSFDRNSDSRFRVLLCRLSCNLNICISLITSVFSRSESSPSRAHFSRDSRSFSRNMSSSRYSLVWSVSSINL